MKWFLFLFFTGTLFAAREPSLIVPAVGVFNLLKKPKTADFQLEVRFAEVIYQRSIFTLRPLLGGLGTSSGSIYLFGGFLIDVRLSPRFFFTPTFSPGVYFKGGGKNLGSPIEFRSSVELSFRREKGDRIGVQFCHISNGGFSNKNPGTECLVVFYGINF
ncbi:MAG: acyloxyacyl hydrolase [Simkaniaceae bacterium]|nr:acyloxyacyl hydrolase [Simkaniaceae bacterium]